VDFLLRFLRSYDGGMVAFPSLGLRKPSSSYSEGGVWWWCSFSAWGLRTGLVSASWNIDGSAAKGWVVFSVVAVRCMFSSSLLSLLISVGVTHLSCILLHALLVYL
jgi:hypothetical protein